MKYITIFLMIIAILSLVSSVIISIYNTTYLNYRLLAINYIRYVNDNVDYNKYPKVAEYVETKLEDDDYLIAFGKYLKKSKVSFSELLTEQLKN